MSKFEILAQSDEARYEFNAAMEALNYAIDLPLEVQRGMASAGNLAWGNGSCQGMVNGDKSERPLTLTVGLKNLQKEIKEEFFCKTPQGTVPEPTAIGESDEFKQKFTRTLPNVVGNCYITGYIDSKGKMKEEIYLPDYTHIIRASQSHIRPKPNHTFECIPTLASSQSHIGVHH